MKKVKELKKWIELYGEVHAAAEELELAYEYVKEEIITEEEVDAAYKKALHLLEDLEFRNMLRDEAACSRSTRVPVVPRAKIGLPC